MTVPTRGVTPHVDVDELRTLFLFESLREEDLRWIAERAEVRVFDGDVVVFTEGEPSDALYVLLDGGLLLTKHADGEDVVINDTTHRGAYSGATRAYATGHPQEYQTTLRTTRPSRFLRLAAPDFAALVNQQCPMAMHLLDGLYEGVRATESAMRQREHLVQLGHLSANLAHELNNPAAAAARAVASLDGASTTMLSAVGRLADGEISAAQFAALDALRREVRTSTDVRDPLDVADAEQALSSWLERHDVARDWVLAPPLAAAGVDLDWCERAATVLPPAALEPGLEWVASTFSATMLLAEVKESTRRISELVSAVRSYSQLDRGSLQAVDLTDGLESTLLMLGHKLRAGTTVVRDYASDVPPVEAFAGELNQVWTNLIDNAVDAMEGSGTLTLRTRPDGSQAVVEIEDTGPGMPPAVAARAFEAFFTTKDVGKGTGLGLDIARRIVVERHAGTIEIDPRPGGTVLRVRLPLRQPSR
jgi:signal transduction histidine kinase